MALEVLDVELVNKLRMELGYTSAGWITGKLGLTRTAGYALLRDGTLPKDDAKRRSALEKLGTLLGVSDRRLVLRLEAKRA